MAPISNTAQISGYAYILPSDNVAGNNQTTDGEGGADSGHIMMVNGTLVRLLLKEPFRDSQLNELLYVIIVIVFYATALMTLIITQIKRQRREGYDIDYYDEYLQRNQEVKRTCQTATTLVKKSKSSGSTVTGSSLLSVDRKGRGGSTANLQDLSGTASALASGQGQVPASSSSLTSASTSSSSSAAAALVSVPPSRLLVGSLLQQRAGAMMLSSGGGRVSVGGGVGVGGGGGVVGMKGKVVVEEVEEEEEAEAEAAAAEGVSFLPTGPSSSSSSSLSSTFSSSARVGGAGVGVMGDGTSPMLESIPDVGT